jgi:hypothetical protein
MTDDDDEMSPVDREALDRAIALVQASKDPGRREQIAQMLSEDPWIEAAHFASFHCQCKALALRPWNSPPAYGDVGDDAAAAALLKRLLDNNLSRWEPNPIAALQALDEARAHGDLPPAAA